MELLKRYRFKPHSTKVNSHDRTVTYIYMECLHTSVSSITFSLHVEGKEGLVVH